MLGEGRPGEFMAEPMFGSELFILNTGNNGAPENLRAVSTERDVSAERGGHPPSPWTGSLGSGIKAGNSRVEAGDLQCAERS